MFDRLRTGRRGFSIQEEMRGEHEFEPGMGPEGVWPFSFRVTWGTDHLASWANPDSSSFLLSELEGAVSVGGLCEDAACSGSLEMRYFSERKIRYEFFFQVDGVHYRYVGEKVNILPWNLAVSHTTCFGVLTNQETGELISRSVTYFRFRDLPSFLSSFRLK